MLNFMLAYEGDDEMVQAVQQIVDACSQGIKVTGDTIKKNLMTKDLPPVDYLIRTAGAASVGRFMMWDVRTPSYIFRKICIRILRRKIPSCSG